MTQTFLRHDYYSEPYLGITAHSRAALADAVSRVAGIIGPCRIIEDGQDVGRVETHFQSADPDRAAYNGAVVLSYYDNRPDQPYLWLADRSISRCLNLASAEA